MPDAEANGTSKMRRSETTLERDRKAEAARLRAGLEPFGSSIAARLRDVSRLYARAIESRSLAQRGLTYGQWRCLRVLWNEDGLSQRELGRRLEMSSAAVVFSVNLLERDGFARREYDVTDKRKVIVRLTLKGRRLREPLLADARELNVRLVRDFSDDDLLRLSNLLDALRTALETEAGRTEALLLST